jgi:hypothetical protein
MLEELIETAIKKVAKNIVPKSLTVGTAINVTDNKCDVKIDGEPDLLDVRLHAIDDSVDNVFIVKPKEESKVLIGFLDKEEKEAVILQCSEVEKVLIRIGATKVEISEEGVSISKGEDSLREIHQLTIEAMMQIVVIIGNNPAYEKLQEALTKTENILI